MRLTIPVAAGWTARLTTAACALLNTRLLIELMGIADYAAVTIVLSLMPWVALMNLGTPNAAQNQISRLRAASDDVEAEKQSAVDTAFLAALALLPLGFLIALPVTKILLSEHSNLPVAWVAIICCGMVFNGFTLVFNQVLYALHRGLWPAIAPAVQALLTSAGLALALWLDAQNPYWAAAAVAAPMLVVFLFSARQVGARPRLPKNWSRVRTLVFKSRGFLLFGAAAQATLACDYVIMAVLLPSDNVVQYNLTSRTFGIVLTLHTVLLAAAWTPMSDLYFRQQFGPLRSQVRNLLLSGSALAVAVALPLVFWMERIMLLLAGAYATALPFGLVISWLAYLGVRVWTDTFATALLSFNDLGTMIRCVVCQAGVSLAAQWFLGAAMGPTGIVLGITVSFLLTVAWVLPRRFLQLTSAGPAPAVKGLA